jgi:hypothetical protein
MPKPPIYYRLLPVLLLTGWCHALPVVVPVQYLDFLPRVQQQSGQPAAAADSNRADPEADEKPSLSDQVIQDVLEPLRNGIQVQDVSQVMAVFDKQVPAYATLQQQFRSFFGLYSEVNFHYQILQVTADKEHGSATADIEMDALPYEATGMTERRTAQMRFQLKLTPKGWKVAGFTPSDFFGPGFNRAETR